MLQIFVNGDTESGFLDLNAGTTLDQETVLPLFDEELDNSDFTLPIDIPWTETNRRLLGYAERMQNMQNTKNFWVCNVFDDQFPEILNGKLTLLEKAGLHSYRSGSFSASISGTRGLFGSKVKGVNLRDIDLGGTIVYSTDARTFAKQVMDGLTIHTGKFAFAPVVIENYFDTSKNYNGEFLARDTVNDIVHTGSGWLFARPTSANAAVATTPGTEEHIDYRTVPFFRFKYILQQALAKAGFVPTGDLWNDAAFDALYLFNTTALENYSTASFTDYNRQFEPTDHIPDMALIDFIRAVFQFFNVYPTFSGTNIYLNYRKKTGEHKQVLDITSLASPLFASKFRESTEESGYEIDYAWDDADDYRSDRVKDIKADSVVATVATIPELGVLNIGRAFTTDDIVLVTAENMYYKVANALSTPVLWDAWSERLGPVQYENGSRKVSVGAGTLCNYVIFNATDALYQRADKLASRQAGNYVNDKAVKVKNDFSLRFFYITRQLISGDTVPISHNIATLPSGGQVLPYSLSLAGALGLDAQFHRKWQKVQEANEILNTSVIADKKLMQELELSNTLQVHNVQYLLRKVNKSVPLNGEVELEMVPL